MTLSRLLISAVVAIALACGTAWGFSATRPTVVGAAGPAGPVGATGPAGATGEAGPAGATGPVGATGATGATGPAGPTGAPGATGPVGPTGAPGLRGAAGPVGNVGATGPSGATGPQGIPGVNGAQGANGATGAVGAAGPMSILVNTVVQNTGGIGQTNQNEPFALPEGLWLLTSTVTLSVGSADIDVACQLDVAASFGSSLQNYYFTGAQEHDSTVTYRGASVFYADGNPARTVYTQCTTSESYTVERMITTATRVLELSE